MTINAAALVDELGLFATEMTFGFKPANKPHQARLRIAVTREEYVALEAHCHARDGLFWARLRDVPLIVDEPIELPRAFTLPSGARP